MRQICAQQLVASNFAKNRVNVIIMFERNYFLFHYCLLSCRYVMFQKQ